MGEISLSRHFIQLIILNRFGTKLKNSSETLSFFARFASFAVKSELCFLCFAQAFSPWELRSSFVL